MKILVISDLHVGPNARAQEFSTSPDNMACRNTPSILKEFEGIFKTSPTDISHILIAGDITQSAEYEEFELASQNISNIAKILKVEKHNIYFVPGNHDGNWKEELSSLKKKEPVDIAISKKYINIEKHPFFSELLANAQFNKMYSVPFAAIWSNDKLLIASINSSAKDHSTNSIHHGLVDLNSIKNLSSELIEIKKENQLKILLTHHHPKNYTDRTFPDNDISIMQNAESFLKFATDNEFDFIVHGHKHIPRFDIHSDSNNFPIVTLSSGSFSASLKDYHNGVANFFHIIEIDSKCPTNMNIRGKVTSWAYFDNNGWIPATKERDYISHQEFFGDIRNKKVLKETFKIEIKERLKNKDYFRWSDLLKQKPELKYCNLSLREKAIVELCQEEKLEYCPMPNNDFMIVREDLN